MIKNKLHHHFQSFSLNQFHGLIIVVFLLLDIFNSIYFQEYWSLSTMKYVQLMANLQGLNLISLGESGVQEIKNLLSQGVLLFLLLIFLNNIFFYIFYFKKKIWAEKYILFYALTNALLGFMFLIEGPLLGWSWYVYNILSIFIYLYLFLGGRYHRIIQHHASRNKEQ